MLKNQVLKSLLFVSLFVFAFSSCDDDDGDNSTPISEQTIAEVVTGDSQFSILLAALQQVGLDATLNDANSTFTVFAPTDAAFQAAGIDLNTISDEALTQTLLYHVFGGAGLRSTEIAEGQTYVSTATATGPEDTQLSLLVERAGGSVTLNGNVNVTTADLVTRNGVIHVIDQVLTPLDVVGHAQANTNFTALVGALVAADGDLVSVLQGDGPFTVFAPLNSAFTAIQSTVDGLTSEQLSQVLLYHVVAGDNVTSDELSNGAVTTANAGGTITVTLGDPVQITDANGDMVDVVLTDVQATNGVIHVLNAVLIPGNL